MKINTLKFYEGLYQQDMNQKELAKIAGLSEKGLTRILNSKNKSCLPNTAFKIADALHMDIRELIIKE